MKKVITAIILGSSLFTASAAIAAPVTITGDTSIKYTREKQDGTDAQSGMAYTLRITGETEIANNLTLFTRLGAQSTGHNLVGSDFNSDAYPDKHSVMSLDQYGLIFKTDSITYKLGRQNATIGTSALLYSRPDTNIGKDNFVDGLSLAGKAGAIELSALMAREDNVNSDNNRVYAVRTGYSPSDNLNVGITLGRYQNHTAPSTNHWALDGTYKYGKNTWQAELARSNSSSDNNAFVAVWNYDVDDKTAFSVTGFRVEENGDMGGQSDFGNNLRGIHYGVTRTLNNSTDFEFVFKNEKSLADDLKTKTYEATINYTF